MSNAQIGFIQDMPPWKSEENDVALRRGFLSDYFAGVAVKRLSAVEIDTTRSNQREFNGAAQLKVLFGQPNGKSTFKARFIWMGQEQETVGDDGFVTWYDARAQHPTRSECRLYFSTSMIASFAGAGDFMFVARRSDQSVMIIFVKADSTILNQLLWLFGIEGQPGLNFAIREISKNKNSDAELDFAARYILDEIGIEFEEIGADNLDALILPFGLKFPTTREFSRLARTSTTNLSARDKPDDALLQWMDCEEKMFRRLERRIVEARLKGGFKSEEQYDVDGFLTFSLSVQNRRKARAGAALEHHLEAIFIEHGLRFERGAETENRNRPDFLFPGQEEYLDLSFPASQLTMLGAKSTLKDRWRQVLSEAEKIKQKHLLTLEPSVSENQTDEMRAKDVQLVLPERLHSTYRRSQQQWLMTLQSFIDLIKERQNDSKGLQ